MHPFYLGFLAAAAGSISPAPDSVSDDALLMRESDGCLEGPMAQFGQYLGRWRMEDAQLASDGSGWQDGPGARWDFVCIGNGTAIQDFWTPNGGAVGTNLRIFNRTTQRWQIAWATKVTPGMTRIEAEWQAATGNIVMNYVEPMPTPPRRITFFPVVDDRWKWQLEQSFDEGKTWTAVYRMSASRINSAPPP